MDGGAWWAAVLGVAQSRTRLKRLSSIKADCYCLWLPISAQLHIQWCHVSNILSVIVVVVAQSLSCIQLCSMWDSSVLHCLPEFTQTHVYESVMPFNHLTLCCPLLLLPSGFLPASGSFPVMWLFTSGGQSIGASASASVLPMNRQDWFPLGWTGWISLQSKGPSRVFSNTKVQKHQFFSAQLSL